MDGWVWPALIGYVIACYLLLIFVTLPVAVFAFAVGIVVGVAVALYRLATVAIGSFAASRIRTPALAAAKSLTGRRQLRFVRRDRAWPIFVSAQVWLDFSDTTTFTYHTAEALASRIMRWVRRQFKKVAVAISEPHLPEVHILWAWPALVPLLGFVLGFAVGAMALIAIYAIAAGTAWLATQGLALTASGVLRLADRAWQRIYRASGSCPVCYEITAVPAFQCGGSHPGEVHSQSRYDLNFDLRPGQLGVLWRTCSCGYLMPTMVQRAAAVLPPFCPTCRAPMHRGAGAMTDVRIPVFGATSVGKTHLVMASMVSLQQVATANAVPAEAADDRSRAQLDSYRAVVDRVQTVSKTDARAPIATTLRLGIPTWGGRRDRGLRRARRGRGTLVHVFDAAGETFVDPGRNEKYWYLDFARTLVFVLDPFSIANVRDTYGSGFPGLLKQANASPHDPEASYRATVTRLRQNGVSMRRKRLAFVVSKADLLAQLPGGLGVTADSASVRNWLHGQDITNLVLSAERDFGEVRYFLTSALSASSTRTEANLTPTSALGPLQWLLNGERVELVQPRKVT